MDPEGHSDELIMQQQRQIEKEVKYNLNNRHRHIICFFFSLITPTHNNHTTKDMRHDPVSQRFAGPPNIDQRILGRSSVL